MEDRLVRWRAIKDDFKALRARVGLNSLAAVIYADRSSVDRWARGVTTPDPRYLLRIESIVDHARRDGRLR
jgi:hypothetical protein